MATPIAAESPAGTLDFAPGAVVVPSTRRKGAPPGKRSQRKVWLAITGGLALLVGIGGAIWGAIWVYNYVQGTEAEIPGIKDTEQANCKYVLPAGPWRLNQEAVARMIVNFSLSRSKPSNNMALFYRDYRLRLPSEAEMLDTALIKLRGHFNPMEWERKPKSDIKLGNQPVALHLEFMGTDNNGIEMNGEVLVLGYQGFGYWFYTWCPADQRETLGPEWTKLRGQFSLLNKRDGWKETPRPKDTISVPDLPYESTFVKEVWKVQAPEKWDPNARIVLVGHDPTEFKHAGKAANFRLLVLEKAAGVKEAFDAAQKYVLEKDKEDYPETVITPTKNKDGKDQISLTDIGSERGYLGRFHVRNSEARERFQMLGAVQGKENTFLLLCDCDFARKDFWETEFVELIRSFKKKKD